jgi:hypothetical protein
MTTEALLIDAALRAWKLNTERTGKFFATLSEEQLLQEVAPGKNRVIYLWGHLAAINDALLPLLGFGPRLHPELDALFITNPDSPLQTPRTGADLKPLWAEIHDALWTAFTQLSPAEWVQKHTAVSDEDFKLEPHRNRFTILLGRNAHLTYHFGQIKLAETRT